MTAARMVSIRVLGSDMGAIVQGPRRLPWLSGAGSQPEELALGVGEDRLVASRDDGLADPVGQPLRVRLEEHESVSPAARLAADEQSRQVAERMEAAAHGVDADLGIGRDVRL